MENKESLESLNRLKNDWVVRDPKEVNEIMHSLFNVERGFAINEEWKQWIIENYQRNCDPKEIVNILREHNFLEYSIKENMKELWDGYVI